MSLMLAALGTAVTMLVGVAAGNVAYDRDAARLAVWLWGLTLAAGIWASAIYLYNTGQ